MQVQSAYGKLALLFWAVFTLKGLIVATVFREMPSLGTAFNLSASAIILSAALALQITHRGSAKLHQTTNMKVLIAYVTWTGLSILWTHADSRLVSLFFWSTQIVDILAVLAIYQCKNTEHVTEQSLKGIIFGALTLATTSTLIFRTGEDGRIEDSIIHINAIGFQLSIAVVGCLYFILKSKMTSTPTPLWASACISALFVLLLATLSKTSIISTVVAVAIVMMLARGAKKVAIMLSLILSMVFVAMWPIIDAYISAYIENYGNTVSALETLSGRTILWTSSIEMIKDSPINGYGIMSFRDIGPHVFSIKVPHAHNEIIQQLFSYGAIGLLLVIATYVSAGKHWARNIRNSPAIASASLLGIAMLVMSLARGVTEAAVVGMVFPLPMLTLLLLASSRR